VGSRFADQEAITCSSFVDATLPQDLRGSRPSLGSRSTACAFVSLLPRQICFLSSYHSSCTRGSHPSLQSADITADSDRQKQQTALAGDGTTTRLMARFRWRPRRLHTSGQNCLNAGLMPVSSRRSTNTDPGTFPESPSRCVIYSLAPEERRSKQVLSICQFFKIVPFRCDHVLTAGDPVGTEMRYPASIGVPRSEACQRSEKSTL
jgi:hypothetical protein